MWRKEREREEKEPIVLAVNKALLKDLKCGFGRGTKKRSWDGHILSQWLCF